MPDYIKMAMGRRKNIVLVAHDNKKQDLLDWTRFNKGLLAEHQLYATGTTGMLLEKELGLTVVKLRSGPLGGDQQIGAKIAEGEIDFVSFFMGPARIAAARPRREGPAQDRGGLEHPCRVQPGHRGLRDLLDPHDRRV